ncbi:MAG TPA: PhzF family phenazine biosynthesis protein [Bacteroidales bacterium]|jgi:PhzF family phenazine biosynthesis protein|nr:PhzF family phenazine biosynthesis protein [Bacteroidales bacterium]
MIKDRTIYQVDAFTPETFKGNPAGVCILDKEMPEEWMKNIAAELHVSETAFITVDGDEYKIRYFTPESEIPLCGHATLSSAHIMYETGIVEKTREINFLSKAGKLKIRYSDGWVVMNFPSYDVVWEQVPEDIERYIGARPAGYYRTGHGWTFILLETEAEVLGLNPDFKALKNSPYGDMIVTAPSSDPAFDFCVRCFAPAIGIDEDPVTGSAHCALVPFWHKKTGRTSFTSHQVSKRGGILKVALLGDRVEIAGQAKTVFRAELYV